MTKQENNRILVFVNKLIKYIIFRLFREKFIVEDLAYIIEDILLRNYQILREIILDRDKLFISKYQRILLVQLEVE